MWSDFDKKLKIIELSICGMVLLVMAAGVLTIWIGSQDADPPELGNLVFEEKEVTAEDNALTYIDKAVAAIVDLKSGWDFKDSMTSDLDDWRLGNHELGDELLSDIMQSNEAVFAWLERAADCEDLILHSRSDPTRRFWNLWGWMCLRDLVLAKARWEMELGRYDVAADVLIDMCRLAQLSIANAHDMVYLLIGYDSEQLAAEEMVHLARMEGVPVTTIRQMSQVLGESMEREASFNRAIKGDYHYACETLNWMMGTEEGRAELISYCASKDVPEYTYEWFMGYRFHPNRTKGMIADHCRRYASDLPATYHDARKAGLVEDEDYAEPGWRDGFKPNAYGRAFASESMQGDYTLSEYYESKFTRDAIRVALAAIAYRKQHGEFPADLNELVGHGLKEVPTDPFDGKPMRYDTVGYRIYTVGTDGLDDPNSRDSQKIDLLSEEELAALEDAGQPEKPHRGRRRE